MGMLVLVKIGGRPLDRPNGITKKIDETVRSKRLGVFVILTNRLCGCDDKECALKNRKPDLKVLGLIDLLFHSLTYSRSPCCGMNWHL
jgi:hypothetical protein